MVEAGRAADLDGCRGTDPLLTQVWPGGDLDDVDDVGNNDYLDTLRFQSSLYLTIAGQTNKRLNKER